LRLWASKFQMARRAVGTGKRRTLVLRVVNDFTV
jgi:hypothetical protein